MTQAAFSNAFGFSLDAVKHWEGGRRTPEASARAFLTVIAKNPNAVLAPWIPASRRGNIALPEHIECRIPLARTQKWAEATKKEGSAGLVKRERGRTLLNQ